MTIQTVVVSPITGLLETQDEDEDDEIKVKNIEECCAPFCNFCTDL